MAGHRSQGEMTNGSRLAQTSTWSPLAEQSLKHTSQPESQGTNIVWNGLQPLPSAATVVGSLGNKSGQMPSDIMDGGYAGLDVPYHQVYQVLSIK